MAMCIGPLKERTKEIRKKTIERNNTEKQKDGKNERKTGRKKHRRKT